METIRSEKLKARKEHFCNLCGCNIQKGETYERQTNKFDGRLYVWRTHLHCQDLCDKIWSYVDPGDGGMGSSDFVDAIIELMDVFYCPFHCSKYDRTISGCEDGLDEDSCIKKFAKFMEKRELRLIRDSDNIPRWRIVGKEVKK